MENEETAIRFSSSRSELPEFLSRGEVLGIKHTEMNVIFLSGLAAVANAKWGTR